VNVLAAASAEPPIMDSKSRNPARVGRVEHNSPSHYAHSYTTKTPATQSKLTVKCREFKPLIRNTLRGFAEVHIGELRLTIKDVAVHVKGGRCWAQVPAKPQVRDGALVKNDEGKVQYIAMLAWDTRAVADVFSDAVVAAVRALVPDAFEADGGVS
jgi:hypothetical protein